MANNRMYLQNKTTGDEVLLAKYYPNTGWYVHHEDLAGRLNRLFLSNRAPASLFGNTDWTVIYEVDNPSNTKPEEKWESSCEH